MDDRDAVTTSDGTTFQIHSELVRGEPRFYWIERRDPGATRTVRDGRYDGSCDARVIRRRLRRRAEEWEREHA